MVDANVMGIVGICASRRVEQTRSVTGAFNWALVLRKSTICRVYQCRDVTQSLPFQQPLRRRRNRQHRPQLVGRPKFHQ